MIDVIQDELEFSICLDAVRRLKPSAILEIGSASGGTLALWLETGVRHLVSVDVSRASLKWDDLQKKASADQEIHLVTGSSLVAETVQRLDAVMDAAGIKKFDVAFIDGAHTYQAVKIDLATCLPRTSRLIILNDPVLFEVGQVCNEITRADPPWRMINVINPNRRLPCASAHTCGSSYLGETGVGNVLMFLGGGQDEDESFNHVARRVEEELSPEDPSFEPTRTWFHQRGLSQSPEYAAYWKGLFPENLDEDSVLFRDEIRLFRIARDLQQVGKLEESLSCIRRAKRARKDWALLLLKRIARRLLRLIGVNAAGSSATTAR